MNLVPGGESELGPNPYIVASVMSGAKQCDDRPYSEAVYNRGAAAVGKSLLEPKRRCSPLATGSDLLPPILASPSGKATIRDPELHTGGVEPPARSLLVEQLAGNQALIGRPFRPGDEGQVTIPTPRPSPSGLPSDRGQTAAIVHALNDVRAELLISGHWPGRIG